MRDAKSSDTSMSVRPIAEDEILLAVGVFLAVHHECPEESVAVERWGRFVWCSCAPCDDDRVHEVLAESRAGGEESVDEC